MRREPCSPVDEIHERATVRHEVSTAAVVGMTDEEKLELAMDILDELGRKAERRLIIRQAICGLREL